MNFLPHTVKKIVQTLHHGFLTEKTTIFILPFATKHSDFYHQICYLHVKLNKCANFYRCSCRISVWGVQTLSVHDALVAVFKNACLDFCQSCYSRSLKVIALILMKLWYI